MTTTILRRQANERQLSLLKEAKDQGRFFHLISDSPEGNSWLSNGSFISFAAYRFANKARCNLLPVRAVQKRIGKVCIDLCLACRRDKETLAHVLNGCKHYANAMTTRHIKILDRTRKAANKSLGTQFIDQKIPGSPGILRPDLVITSQNEMTIVDVTVPIENDTDAFKQSRETKTAKYAELVDWARAHYETVNFGVLVVGSLGAWDTENASTLKLLGIGRRYAILYKKLCCIDAIEGSLEIWRQRNRNFS